MNYMYLQTNKLIIGRTVQLLKLKLNCFSIFRHRKFFYLAFFNLNCEAFKFDITLYEAGYGYYKAISITHQYKLFGILTITID